MFTVGAAGSAMASSLTALVAMRLLQAVGAAAIIANATALLTDAVPGKQLGTAMGVTSSVFSVFGLAGPVLGGLLVAAFGGRGVSWFAVPFGIVGFVVAMILLRRPDTVPASRQPFDALDATLSASALTGVMVLLSHGPTWGWTSPLSLGVAPRPMTIGAIVGAPVAGRLVVHLSARAVSRCGAAVHAVALLTLAVGLDAGPPYGLTVACLAAIGLGSVFFGTPNTYAIMASVPGDQRGVANALRSTVQNTAGLAGTAFVLALVGDWAAQPGAPLTPFRTAMLALCGLCAVATAVSLLRGTPPVPQAVR